MLTVGAVLAQTARVQIIHNCADDAAANVDIYAGNSILLEDVAFRTSTAFLDLPANTVIAVGIAPGNSSDVNDVIASFDVTFVENETYIVVASGIVSPGYSPSPAFNLEVFAGAREEASDMMGTDVLVFHGSTDAPTVDVEENELLNVTAVDNLMYADFAGYLELPTVDVTLDVTDETGAVAVASYDAPLATLGLNGAAITVLASGFLNPANNSDGPGFGLWVATAAGGALIPLPLAVQEPVFARVQVIHNCPDAAASQVDVYLNGDLLLDNFAFRTATPFIDAPAAEALEIAIAPATSVDVNDAIVTFPFILTENQTYILVASGIVSISGYSPSPIFNLEVYEGAREEASDMMGTDVLVFHGSTDAPTVDVEENELLNVTAVDNLMYSDFSDYLELPTVDVTLDVTDETGAVTVASYEAPLATLGLNGAAITVLASGFLNPANNSDGAGFGLWVATAAGGALIPLPLEVQEPVFARAQVIHNCPDAAASQVDVYLNGGLLLNDFAFRTATPFVDVPAAEEIEIAIAPSNSDDVSDAIATFTYTLTENETYIIVANGIVNTSAYNPAPAFNLEVFAGAREVGSELTATDVLVFHGSTDAPTVDVVENELLLLTAVDDLNYAEFAGYLELPTANYGLAITDATGTVTVAEYSAPLSALNLGGQAITVLASGFLSPTQNSGGPGFGLWVALASGGNLIALPTSTASVQIIHNCADAAASVVDIYTNGFLLANDVEFRTATPFVNLPAGIDIDIAIAPGDSESAEDAVATFANINLMADEKYIVVASGIVSGTGYNPAPAFNLEIFAGARDEASDMMGTDVLVFHGSTDAPTVDVEENVFLNVTAVDNLMYSDFAGYLELPTVDVTLDVTDETGTVTVASYAAPLATLGLDGAAITVLASGFLNPANNSNGPAFGLWVALPSGGELIPLPLVVVEPVFASAQVIHNCADAAAEEVDVYLNGGLLLNDFAFRTATPFVDLPAAVEIEIAIAPSNSDDVSDAIATFNYTLTEGETYVIIASGIVSATGYNPAPGFDLKVFAGAREEAVVATNTDVLVFHGSTDAPAVDVNEVTVPVDGVVNNLPYGNFAGYVSLSATNDYALEVQDQTGTVTVGTYAAPLNTLGLDGAAITVFASGFLNPANNSDGADFGLWVALADGTTLPLPLYVGVQENALTSGLSLYPNPVSEQLILSGLLLSNNAQLSVIDVNGRVVKNISDLLNKGNFSSVIDVNDLDNGVYNLQIISGRLSESTRFIVNR